MSDYDVACWHSNNNDEARQERYEAKIAEDMEEVKQAAIKYCGSLEEAVRRANMPRPKKALWEGDYVPGSVNDLEIYEQYAVLDDFKNFYKVWDTE